MITTYDQLKNVTKVCTLVIGHPCFPVTITKMQFNE